jgi:hypothetical protein
MIIGFSGRAADDPAAFDKTAVPLLIKTSASHKLTTILPCRARQIFLNWHWRWFL